MLQENEANDAQEHTVYFITRLLSLPVPADHSGTDSHLIRYDPMLNVLLVGIATVDYVQIFTLHGLLQGFKMLRAINPCDKFVHIQANEDQGYSWIHYK
ncbi:hypothetical protein AgCh_008497 [Apium graveolens]